MDLLNHINIVTVLFVCIFTIPILAGVLWPLTGDRIRRSLDSLRINLVFLASVILSIYLTRLILSGYKDFVLTNLYTAFPTLQNVFQGNDILLYALSILILFLIFDGILLLMTLPFERHVFDRLAGRLSLKLKAMNAFWRCLISGAWRLPKSMLLVLVFCIFLNFYTGFFNSNLITEQADDSAPYQWVQESVIQPLLNNSVVKDIRVLLDDSFKAAENGLYNTTGKYLAKYFNGVPLRDAVQSDADIDKKSMEIVGSETDASRKAYLLYLWICSHITYDNGKAEIIANKSYDVDSGAIVAYNSGTGICLDFACLYVAMCRAVGLNVRFITGLGFSGTEWGDHAWNQVYDPAQERWIDVDTTFGSTGIDYFDRKRFYLDHRDGVVQGEW